jgi:parallel beta-helix repeat protein
VLHGNRIGTDGSGSVALGNVRGIHLHNHSGTTVGGTAAGAGNLISGNAGDGIFFFAGSNNLVQGNRIGTDVSGTLALGNGGNGVDLSAGAHDNTIGGAAPGAGNGIAFNGHDGVLIDGGDSNLVSRNSIFANAHLGIELLDGGNNDQAAPHLTSAKAHRRAGLGGFTTIQGTFTGQPATTYTLEFYADSGTPAQGRQFLGSITVTTDAHGSAHISLRINLELSPGEFVTATATDPNNNTSAFSAGVAVTGA